MRNNYPTNILQHLGRSRQLRSAEEDNDTFRLSQAVLPAAAVSRGWCGWPPARRWARLKPDTLLCGVGRTI
jgi:hypothetical protein